MSIAYIDASALVKQYVAEAGSGWVRTDDQLLAIAQAEGLVTDNPNRHP